MIMATVTDKLRQLPSADEEEGRKQVLQSDKIKRLLSICLTLDLIIKFLSSKQAIELTKQYFFYDSLGCHKGEPFYTSLYALSVFFFSIK